jgi:hypothetical protein
MNFDFQCIHITLKVISPISQILKCILHLNANSSDILYRVTHMTLQFCLISHFVLAAMRPFKFTVYVASFMCC